ncbi:MAG: hypothetical protein M1818_003698 [Claussenomyces sp. TS43310]|nr:MAG: hypothetical protein M1818_003698 [Claussenomyces sp. TS43310]
MADSRDKARSSSSGNEFPPEASEESTAVSTVDRGLRQALPGMADPFEVRMKFSNQIGSLNATTTSAQKAAYYAIKYRDMDEDLHSCILEQLERNSMNNRANIMYFLEHLCDLAAREGHPDYIRMMQRDILRIVDAVAPENGSGAANVKVVRRVLQGLQQKGHLHPDTVKEIDECLKERDAIPDHIGLSSPTEPADTEMGGSGITEATPRSARPSVAPRLDKEQIIQRIEEDRERHKRLREHQWAIPYNNDDAEFDEMWENTSSINSDDYRLFEEEAEQRKQCGKEHAEDMEAFFAAQAQNGE